MNSQIPNTRRSLLIEIRDPTNQRAWCEFADVYRPLIIRLAKIRGLQDADAEDLTQQVLLSVAAAIDRWEYDPKRARFRTWLKRVADNAIINALSRAKPDRGSGSTSIVVRLDEEPASDGPTSELLCIEFRREVFRWAAREIQKEFRPETWDAFWLSCVDGVSVSELTEQLGKSRGAIYVARSRVISRLQQKIEEFDETSDM